MRRSCCAIQAVGTIAESRVSRPVNRGAPTTPADWCFATRFPLRWQVRQFRFHFTVAVELAPALCGVTQQLEFQHCGGRRGRRAVLIGHTRVSRAASLNLTATHWSAFRKSNPSFVPEGQDENSPAFQRREPSNRSSSPGGTAERFLHIQGSSRPSLRDFCCFVPQTQR